MEGWISVAQARVHILAHTTPLAETAAVPVADALWRVVGADVVAPFDVPGHNNSAMDGYACQLADVSGSADAVLRVIGAAFAGSSYGGKIGRGECVRIMTGARLPVGCEIVVPQEESRDDTDGGDNSSGDDTVTLTANPARRAGQNLRTAGEDLQSGAVALKKGELCFPAAIGLLASLGLQTVPVFRRLRVAFFSTGDEIRRIGEPLGDSDVYDSNRHTLRTMLQRMNCEAVDFGIVPDNKTQLAETVDRAAADADAVITSGGASVGEADFIRTVLNERGGAHFWKVAMRPGRPLTFANIGGGGDSDSGGVPFFGLPGNPVSVMVCFYQFVRPALWRLAGRNNTGDTPLLPARTTTDLRKTAGRTEYQRGHLTRDDNGDFCVTVTGDQGSGILSSMTAGNCFIVLPADSERARAGDTVWVQPFEGLV